MDDADNKPVKIIGVDTGRPDGDRTVYIEVEILPSGELLARPFRPYLAVDNTVG